MGKYRAGAQTPPSVVPLAVWIAFVAVCVALVVHARFTADLSAFLPRHPTPEQAVLIDQLRDGPASRLILIGVENEASPASAGAERDEAAVGELAEFSKAFARRLRAQAALGSVSNGEPVTAERDRRLLFDHRYLLSPATSAQRYGTAGLHASLEDSVDLLSSSAGAMFAPLFPRDPTGEMLRLVDRYASGHESAGRADIDGVWIASRRKGSIGGPHPPRALLLAQTRASGSDIDGQQAAVEAIRAACDATRAEAAESKPPGSRAETFHPSLVMTGPGVFAVASRATVKSEAARFSAIGSALIVALLLAIYRSLPTLFLGLLPMATGILAGIAAVSLGFGAVHGITLAFGVTLIGESVDYAIYLFIQGRPEERDGAPMIDGFWRTIGLGVLTSIIGFSSLLFSGFTGLAQLGLFSIAGLVAAVLVTRLLLPSLMTALMPENFAVPATPRIGKLLQALAMRAPRMRWIVALMVVAACGFLMVQRDRLWNRSLASLSPISASEQALDAELRADLGAPDVRALVVVDAPDEEAALHASERIGDALEPLVGSGTLGGIEAASQYLPSVAMQRERSAALPETAELRARFAAAAKGLPLADPAAGFEGFFADVAAQKKASPLTRADLEGTSLAIGVDALLHRRENRWIATTALRAPLHGSSRKIDGARIHAALKDIDFGALSGAPVDVRYVDIKAESEKLYAGYLDEAIRLALWGAVAIVAMLALALRSPGRLARVCAPLAAAVVIVAAVLAALANAGPASRTDTAAHGLTLFHLVGLLLIVAVGSNYALFFDRRSIAPLAGRAGDAGLLASMLFANMTTVMGFGMLAFSRVPVLHAIGSTVGIGAFAVLILSAILAQPPRNSAAQDSGGA